MLPRGRRPADMAAFAALLFLSLMPAGLAQVQDTRSYRAIAGRSEEETIGRLREGAKEINRLELPHDLDMCVPRTMLRPSESDGTGARKLGVVIVVCEEDMSFLEEVGCRDGQLQYYIFSSCGVSRKDIARRVKAVAECVNRVKEAPLMLYSELSQTLGHTEYLTHILQNFEELDQNLIFTRARLARTSIPGMMPLQEVVDIALSGKWAYKPLWPMKMSVTYEKTPSPGDLERFASELCTVHKRFTCETECNSCPQTNVWTDISNSRADRPVTVDKCSYVAPGGSFITTAARVRSLPASEYSWAREWLQSWQEDEQGALHKSIAERMWPLMLGCPEDLHSNISDSGCLEDMTYKTEGRLLKPPDEFIDRGLIHFPPPSFKHDNSHPYPHLNSPVYKHQRDITFVVCIGAHLPPNIELNGLLKALVGQIVYFHPSALVVALVRSELMEQVNAHITWPWFSGRLQLLEIETEHEMGNFGVMHSDIDSDAEVRDWVRVNWMQSYSFEMRQQYLRMLANGQIRRADGEDAETHHAFISLNSVLLDNLWPAFDLESEDPFTIGLPVRPLPNHAVDSSLMLVHRDRINQAADAMDELLSNHLLHGGFRGSFDQAVQERFLDCLPEGWWANMTARTVSCAQASTGSAGKIRLLPSGTWNGLVMKGGDGPTPWLMQEWAAAMAEEGARVVRLVLYGSGTFIHRDMTAVFRSTRDRHDPTSRKIAAFQNANLTFHHDLALKESTLKAAGVDIALYNVAQPSSTMYSPRHLASPHRHLRSPRHFLSSRHKQQQDQQGLQLEPKQQQHRRSLATPHHLSTSNRHTWHEHTVGLGDLEHPELRKKSPEEDRYNFDDPLMDAMYEIQNPTRPSKEVLEREIAEEQSRRPLIAKTAEPRFPRAMHNRQYMDKLNSSFRDRYMPLLDRPSPLQKMESMQQQLEHEHEEEGQEEATQRQGGFLGMLRG